MKADVFLAETVTKTGRTTRVGQLVGQMASERLGVEFSGIADLSLRQHQQLVSVARVLEAMGLEVVGTHGTLQPSPS